MSFGSNLETGMCSAILKLLLFLELRVWWTVRSGCACRKRCRNGGDWKLIRAFKHSRPYNWSLAAATTVFACYFRPSVSGGEKRLIDCHITSSQSTTAG